MKTIYIRPGWRCTLDLFGKFGAEAATIDGPIQLEITSGAEFGTIERLGDAQFRFVAGDSEGAVLLTASGDANLNEEVSTISTEFQIVIEEEADRICVEASAFASGSVE